MMVSTYTDISPTLLRLLLDYDPNSGKLYWKARGDAAFDRKYAGKEAFTTTHSGGYKSGKILGVPIKAHRAAWAVANGAWPNGEIDHIDHNKTDNRLANLRVVSRQENAKNLGIIGRIRNWPIGVRLVKGKYWIAYCGRYSAHCKSLAAACAKRLELEKINGCHPNHCKVAA